VRQGVLLEVGCASGFVLDEALDQGWAEVHGVEPSQVMVAAASPRVKPHIACDILRSGLFAPASFDALCMFQTFDHLPNPAGLLDVCYQVLRPGGLILLLNHNVTAFSAKLLGERSPIIDLQHTYLYSPATVARILNAHGFHPLEVGSVQNDYTLRYLGHLAPLPGPLKALSNAILTNTPLGNIPVSVPLGNLYAIARKPGGA
jgi:SAM-dependent methyltransferase